MLLAIKTVLHAVVLEIKSNVSCSTAKFRGTQVFPDFKMPKYAVIKKTLLGLIKIMLLPSPTFSFRKEAIFRLLPCSSLKEIDSWDPRTKSLSRCWEVSNK